MRLIHESQFSALNHTFSPANEKITLEQKQPVRFQGLLKVANEIAGKGKENCCIANFATFIPKILLYISIKNENGCNNMVIELSGVQFWSEIILMISNRTCTAQLFAFEVTGMISD